MKKLVLLAVSAAALAVPATTASASCTTTPGVGANTVSLCNRRVWEKQQYYYTCSVDKDLDGQADAYCKETVVIEFYG